MTDRAGHTKGADHPGPAVEAARTYALLGWPLEHSLSPAMHRAAFRELGFEATYVLRPTAPEDLASAVDDLRSGGLDGANVTVPHKTAARRLVDQESEVVAAVGAVNTIVRAADGLYGENTDVAGFQHALAALDLADGDVRRALVLGAGGAARAIVYALIEAGCAVRVLARRTGQSGVLVAGLHRTRTEAVLSSGPLVPETLVADAGRSDLLVNATPVGAAPRSDGSLWPDDVPVPSHLAVMDIVAWPVETRLVKQARAAGARAIGGLPMLVGQAAAAFELWTGRAAPLETMHRAAVEAAASGRAAAAPSRPGPPGDRNMIADSGNTDATPLPHRR